MHRTVSEVNFGTDINTEAPGVTEHNL